jgi:putative phage-type endonuclease
MSMITHNIDQGSESWHQFRAWPNKNASDAPAMMNASPYKTRAQLLREKATGITPEVDAATQRRFDDGHRFEALARALAEEIVGDDLYPIVASNNNGYSASFDGITMSEDVAFEHKSLNSELRGIMSEGCSGLDLPTHYQVQMEQQCLVANCDKVLFMASKWDDNDQLIEEHHCWYFPNLELREKILFAWKQFDKDVAAYEHVEHPEKPQAEATESFLVPFVQVKGELAIVSNLDSFGQQLRSFVDNMSKDPQDDQDFANLESAVKKLKEAEDALEKTESYALAQFADVNTMRRTVVELKELARSHRLTSEKLVKSQKELIKMRILEGGKKRFDEHVIGLQKEIIGVTLQIQQPDFAGAMKNKRTIASLHDAVDTCLANAKIDSDAVAKVVRGNMAYLDSVASGFRFLFNDLQTIAAKQPEDFAALVDNRVAQHKKAEQEKLEAERKRIQEEEQRKAEGKIRAEQESERRRIQEEERARIRADEAEKAKAEAKILIDKAEREDLEKFKAHQAAMIEEASEGFNKGVTLAGPDAGKGILGGAGTIAIKDLVNMEPCQKIAPVEKQQSWIEPEKPESKLIAVITVGRDEYAQLKRDSQFLVYLKELGVDNWNGWEQACAMLDEYDKNTAYKVKAA